MISLDDAARLLEQEFTAQMTELAAFRADWPVARRERLALRGAAFANSRTRMDAIRHVAASLRAAERQCLPSAALPDIGALARWSPWRA